MKEKPLEDYCKKWTIEEIVKDIFSAGVCFMTNRKMPAENADVYKATMVKEIKRRIKKTKR